MKTVPSLQYQNDIRSGFVIYSSPEGTFRIPYEFGGGNCVVYLDVPTPSQWENRTRLPLASRPAVLEFIARQIIEDQAPGCRYQISDHTISVYDR